jgi:hypothetical protein
MTSRQARGAFGSEQKLVIVGSGGESMRQDGDKSTVRVESAWFLAGGRGLPSALTRVWLVCEMADGIDDTMIC